MDFHFITAGSRSKPPVIFLHGFMGEANDWKEIIDELADDYYTVALDLPGHGQTTIPGLTDAFSFPELSSALMAWLKSEDIIRPTIVGYSMGGRIATYLAIHYSDKISKLILESASPGLANQDERAARFAADKKLAEKLEAVPFEEFLRDWYEQSLFSTLSEEQKRILIDSKKKQDKKQLAQALLSFSTGLQPSLWDKIDRIEADTHLIAGELDGKFVSIGKKMKERCLSFSLSIIPKAGHIVHVEKRIEYIATLKELLSR